MVTTRRRAPRLHHPDLPEPELLEGLAADLDGTFEAFVLAYQDRLFGFTLRLVGNRADAEEIAQDAFIQAYRALERYEAERIRTLAPRPWLFQIALNLARNRTRRRQVRATSLNGDHPEGEHHIVEPAAPVVEEPAEKIAAYETADQLIGAIDQLSDALRPALLLRHVHGLSYAEVAAALDQPIGTVKANVHRALAQLRQHLAPIAERNDR